MAQGIHDSCEMEDENDRLFTPLETSNIEKFIRETSNNTSNGTSYQGSSRSQTMAIRNVEQSFKLHMLPLRRGCSTANCLVGGDGSYNSVDNVLDTAGQELNSVSKLATVLTATELDSADSFTLPSPPTGSPKLAETAKDRDSVSAVSTDVVDSISSRVSFDSYVWSSANSDLPSWILDDDEDLFIWPLKDEFSVTDKYEENEHYVLSTKIGKGAYGECFLASEVTADDTIKGRVFCVKKCQYRKNELLALQLAKKENVAEIVGFFGAKIRGNNANIFMEFMAGGTIADLLKEIKKCGSANWPIISETDSLSFLEDVLKGVKFLHCKGIVHRDVKGENALLDEYRLHAKLTDFGSAESCKDASFSIDIWKIACLLLEMLNGERPPLFVNEGSLQRQNSCNPEDHIPFKVMPETRELLRFCFGLKTTDRNCLPSAAEVLKCSGVFPVTELLKRLKPSAGQVPGSENPS